MESIIAQLFAIRDTAHLLHLKTKSFAKHIALGDFYEGILDLTDSISEIYQGKYGIINVAPTTLGTLFQDEVGFIQYVASWAESSRVAFNPADTNILNEWDNVLSLIYKTKYKLENLA